MDQYTYNKSGHRSTRRSLWDRTWKDKGGHVVMWQMPNVWIISWAVGTTLSLVFGGHVGDVFYWVASAALFVWSLLEIFKGTDYFRRALGLAVLVYTIASMLNSL